MPARCGANSTTAAVVAVGVVSCSATEAGTAIERVRIG